MMSSSANGSLSNEEETEAVKRKYVRGMYTYVYV